MKRYLLAITLFICVLTTVRTQAQDCCACLETDKEFYIGAFAGANWFDFKQPKHIECKPKFDVGFHGSIVAGYKFYAPFRIEAELAYRRNKIDHFKCLEQKIKIKSDTHSWSLMANVLYDFEFDCLLVKPYVGIGVGGTRVSIDYSQDDFSFKHHGTGFAWQAIAGASYPIYNDIDLAVEYHYFQGREHAKDHSVGLSVKRYF